MTYYRYKAVDIDGNVLKGYLFTLDQEMAKAILKSKKFMLIYVKPVNNLFERFIITTHRKLNSKQISFFCKQLCIIIKAGGNILTGLEVLKQQSEDRVLKNVAEDLYIHVQKGLTVSEAIANTNVTVPILLINMITVGEISGNLENILERMSNYFEKESFIAEKLRGAMIYPAILIFTGIGLLVFFINFVMPEIISMLRDNGVELPLLTKGVIFGVDIVKNYYYVLIIFVIGFVLLIKYLAGLEKVNLLFTKLILKLPFIGIGIRNAVTSTFLRTASMMLKSGISFLDTFQNLERLIGNSVVKLGMRKVIDGMRKGEGISENLESCNFFDPVIIQMIKLCEKTGNLDNVLETLGEYYDKEAEIRIAKMVALIEPLFTIIIGIVASVLIMSMMIPILTMASNIK